MYHGYQCVPVRDQRLDAVAGLGESILLPRADPVQHLDLEPIPRDTGRRDLLGDLLDQRHVVRAETEPDRRPRPVLRMSTAIAR